MAARGARELPREGARGNSGDIHVLFEIQIHNPQTNSLSASASTQRNNVNIRA